MDDQEDLAGEERDVRELLVSASGARMPDEVFSRIAQALSVEVQLRHEDPERDTVPHGRASNPADGRGLRAEAPMGPTTAGDGADVLGVDSADAGLSDDLDADCRPGC